MVVVCAYVLPDIAHRGFAEAARADNRHQVAFDEGDVCAFDCDVRTGSHRNTHMCRREGGGVVNAVAGHRHDPPRRFQLFNCFHLLFR
jgi:hypothetical protein